MLLVFIDLEMDWMSISGACDRLERSIYSAVSYYLLADRTSLTISVLVSYLLLTRLAAVALRKEPIDGATS